MVPLFVNQGLGVALFSNHGRIYWGFNADWDVIPDLHDFVEATTRSFEELLEAARNTSPKPTRSRRRTSRKVSRRVSRKVTGSTAATGSAAAAGA